LWAGVAAHKRGGAPAPTGSETGPESRARRPAVAGFDLTFSPPKSVSTAWALADQGTQAVIYDCHRRALVYVLAYAEENVLHARSGTNGVAQEDVDGVVAAAFTHYDSRAGDPQLHDHVVVWNRARTTSDGRWRTLDSGGLFKHAVALSELHQGVLSDMLTEALGVGWDGRARRHSERPRWEVTGVAEELLAEFSTRAGQIEVRREELLAQFHATHGRAPSQAEVLRLRQRATIETRPDKAHRSLAEMTEQWRRRAAAHLGCSPVAWVQGLARRNDLPLLRASDFAEQMLADAAAVVSANVAAQRATFSRANLLAEAHRLFHGVRFASPDDRVSVVEATTDMATAGSVLLSAPERHHVPEAFRRADGSSKFRARGHGGLHLGSSPRSRGTPALRRPSH
jgi:conjugative relaxase-like TrwC/TraI family protein